MDHRSVLSRAQLLNRLPKINRGTSPAPQASKGTDPGPASEKPLGGPPAPTSPGDVLQLDHAVFTSIRTPTGEGYRIIAATPGVTIEEKTEITRRSPSHGALTGSGDAAVGLSCYPLPTGRYVVAWSRHAGKEHTARGGERVYTHVAILSGNDYAAYGCNPAWVHALLAATIGENLMLKPPARLEPLALPRPGSPAARAACTAMSPLDSTEIACLLTATGAVLANSPLILAGCVRPWDAFKGLVETMPLFARTGLSASIGLRFSPSRQFGFCLVDRDQGETQRAVLGQTISLVDANKLPPPGGACAAWLQFVQERIASGQARRLSELAAKMTEAMNGAALAQVAETCTDSERVSKASLPDLLALRAKYAARGQLSRLAQDLTRTLLWHTDERIQQLQQIEAEMKRSISND